MLERPRADIVNIKRPRKSRLPKTLALWNENENGQNIWLGKAQEEILTWK